MFGFVAQQNRPVIVVLRSHGDDEYNDAFFGMPGVAAVATFIVSSKIGTL